MDWTPSTAQRDSNSRPRDPSSIAFFEAKDLSVVYLFSYLFPYSSFRAKFHSFLLFLSRHRTTFISVRCLAFGSQTLDANTSGKRPLGFVCPHATIKNCPVLLTFLLLITAINKGNVQRKWQEKKKRCRHSRHSWNAKDKRREKCRAIHNEIARLRGRVSKEAKYIFIR